MMGIEPGLVVCKSNTQHSALLVWPLLLKVNLYDNPKAAMLIHQFDWRRNGDTQVLENLCKVIESLIHLETVDYILTHSQNLMSSRIPWRAC